MFRTLLDKVRVKGQISTGSDSPLLRDRMPIVYEREAPQDEKGNLSYYNSGGRSLLVQIGGVTYRIKGVDPSGNLTKRVAESKENRMNDVRRANKIVQDQISEGTEDLRFREEKPFGPFTLEQAELEMEAFKRLAKIYQFLEIENPCEALFHRQVGQTSDIKTYQTAFRLPRPEADLRVHEYMALLTERLDSCSQEEIKEKTQNINRLFGRMIYWIGINVNIFSATGILPKIESFHPQNWVISRYHGGYGIFRVDHTSTRVTNTEEVIRELLKEEEETPKILHNFSIFPSRVFMASQQDKFLGTRKYKFNEILNMKEAIKVGAGLSLVMDGSKLIEVQRNVFLMGLTTLGTNQKIAPIPEEMFQRALE